MNNELWAQIEQGEEVRQNLSTLRQRLRRDENGKTFGKFLKNNEKEEFLIELLSDEDAKIRRNAALLMGECENKVFREPLMKAYEAEDQLFVRSSYLTALAHFDCSVYQESLSKQYQMLCKEDTPVENRKHVDAELKALSIILAAHESAKKHSFRGLKGPAEVYLTTKPCCTELTAQQVENWNPEAEVQEIGAGVLVKTNQIHWRNQIRTYKELLFRIKGMESCPLDPVEAAKKIAKSNLLLFLESCHKGDAPFYFRVELRSKLETEKKTDFAKKMAITLERLTERKLVNSVSDYEVIIRLIENKRGTYMPFVRLMTIGDDRFAYRKEYTAESMKPVNAAMVVALAKEYMQEEGQVLDPFCGAGTLLIERQKAVRAKSCYGIDIKGEALAAAGKNTPAAGQVVNYIRRDFFTFTHEYLFDEIITDMPFPTGIKSQEEICELYRKFFLAARWVLRPGGIMILYTRNKEYVDRFAPKAGYTILKDVLFDGKGDTSVMVLKYKEEK